MANSDRSASIVCPAGGRAAVVVVAHRQPDGDDAGERGQHDRGRARRRPGVAAEAVAPDVTLELVESSRSSVDASGMRALVEATAAERRRANGVESAGTFVPVGRLPVDAAATGRPAVLAGAVAPGGRGRSGGRRPPAVDEAEDHEHDHRAGGDEGGDGGDAGDACRSSTRRRSTAAGRAGSRPGTGVALAGELVGGGLQLGDGGLRRRRRRWPSCDRRLGGPLRARRDRRRSRRRRSPRGGRRCSWRRPRPRRRW